MARAGTGHRGRDARVGETLYGRNSILEALRAGRRRFDYLAVARGTQPGPALSAILEAAAARKAPVRQVERQDLDQMVPDSHGVALQASGYPYDEFDALAHLQHCRIAHSHHVMR